MILLIETLLVIGLVLILLPTLVLLMEIASSFRRRAVACPLSAPHPTIAVLIPAHNEAGLIATTLGSIVPQLARGDRVLVVADNCSDRTSEIAAAAGAEVLVRTDAARRGKGYALDLGVRFLEKDPPEVLVIVDADCAVSPGSIARLAQTSKHSGRAAQALNLVLAPPGSGVKQRIAQFACTLKNHVRPTGLSNLGLPCQLMGTGMAFPWAVIRDASLATGHIVEDLKLGIDCTRAGVGPLFCPDAQVSSYFPVSEEGFKGQRTRWEHGHLGVLLKDAPSLLLQAVMTRNIALAALALDLIVPPLALLALLIVAASVISLVGYLEYGLIVPLGLASTALAAFTLAVSLTWFRYGRSQISVGTLFLAAFYAIWKFPLYFRFLIARQREWVRSKRDSDRS